MRMDLTSTRTSQASAFTLIELMIVVAIIAILAMVAIPAFVKYIRRSKTVEATMNIRKMYDSSVSYFATERASRSGGEAMLPRQFPPDWFDHDTGQPIIMPPPEFFARCCNFPGGKCPPVWRWPFPPDAIAKLHQEFFDPLNFSLDEPFSFHYAYRSTGTDRTAQFTAGAFGNLDCDDEWSTYERTGSVDSGFNVVGGGGLYIHNDIE